jgi:Ca-activated chloride channel family protein
MRLELDDPRLMDYVLGELEDGEALSVAAALEQEENKEARELVEELRGVTEMTRRILHEEDPGVALSDEQRAAIVGTVGEDPFANVERFRRSLIVLSKAVAAVLLIGAFASVIGYNTLGGVSPEPLLSRAEPIEGQESARLAQQLEQISPEQSVALSPQRNDFEVNDEVLTYSQEGLGSAGAQGAPPASTPAEDLKNVEIGGSVQIRGNWLDGDTPTGAGRESDQAVVEQRTRLGVKTDFADEPSTFIEFDGYNNWGDADDAELVEARNRLEMKANLRDGLSLSYENEKDDAAIKSAPSDGLKQKVQGELQVDGSLATNPVEEQWAEYNVGNLTGQTALPEQVASHMPEDISPFAGNMSAGKAWQWNTPTDKPTEIVGGPGTETYVKVAGVKPFVAVKDEPLSTFSIDVDTAAYSNVRRFLSQGQLPPADAVRIEEMINYFAYSYPQPTDGRPFAVAVHGAPAPWAPERQLVRIGVKGKEVPASERPPANLVFLLDVSGSMGDANKLPLVKESMKTLLSQLRPNDRVGIVTYAGDARQVLGSTPCSEGAAITQAIESLNSGGSTNGGGGIQVAYDLAQSNFIKEGINRVVMATDGDFNVGATEHGDLMGLIEARAKSGVFLTTLGFGMGNLKDSTLEQLANRGNGNYAYIDNHAEARKALVDQLSGTLQTIAKDVKIQVEFNPAKVSHYRLLGYENRALANQDFNDDTKDAGEIGAGHTVTALYEIIPAGGTPVTGVDALKHQRATTSAPVSVEPSAPSVDPLKYQTGVPAPGADVVEPSKPGFGGEERFAPGPIPTPLPEPMPVPAGEWLTVKMRYKQPEGNESTKIDVPLLAMNGDLREVDADFRFASAVAAFGQVLRNSGYRHSSNFDRIVELARGASNGDAEREAFVDLVITAKTLSTQNR